jgi:hypothetical protein
MKKIDAAIEYYASRTERIQKKINSSSNLSIDQIIKYGKELSVLEYKLTALEIAKEN